MNWIKFIGPTPAMINAMGDKSTAKDTMKRRRTDIPGSEGLLDSIEQGSPGERNRISRIVKRQPVAVLKGCASFAGV